MYLRGLLICLKEDKGANIRLLYNRCFPTSELKAKQLHDDSYIPFSDVVNDLNATIARLSEDSKKLFLPPRIHDDTPLHEEGHNDDDDEQERDKAWNLVFADQFKPVYALRMSDDRKMWPVVMLEQGDVMALAFPLVEVLGDPLAVPMHKINALAPTYELLVSILDFVTQNTPTVSMLPQQRLKDLTMALTVNCPFGLITSSDLQRLRRILRASIVPGAEMLPAELDTDAKATPSFRPVFPADKESVSALLVERISCVQTAEQMMTNISGCCWLCAELASAGPVVSIPLSLPPFDEDSVKLFISPHAVIERQQQLKPSGSGRQHQTLLLLSVNPPNDWFPLFIYEVKTSPEPPIFGLLHAKLQNATTVKLTFQLKLAVGFQNIELTDLGAVIALPSSLQIARTPGVDPITATHGDIGVETSNSESNKIAWRLGDTRLPSGDKAATLKGTLSTISGADPEVIKRHVGELYAALRFTWRGGQTCARISLRLADAKVQPPRLRPRFAVESRVETVTYRIYNTA